MLLGLTSSLTGPQHIVRQNQRKNSLAKELCECVTVISRLLLTG